MSLVAGRVAGSLVALGVLSAGTMGVVAMFLEHRLTQTSTLVAGRLVVTDDVGDVVVHAGPAGQIRVVRTWHWSASRPADAATPLTGPADSHGTATIDNRCGGGFGFDNCSVDLDITMPPETALQISITTGDVRVDGSAGPLQVRSATGDITATGLRTADPVLEAGVGDVSAHFAAPPDEVHVSSTTGDVVVGVPAGQEYLVRARTSTGDPTISVATSTTSSRTIDATTHAGDVSVVTDPGRAP